MRPFLYRAGRGREEEGRPQAAQRETGPPVVTLEPFTEAEAAEVYQRYQTEGEAGGDGYVIPACRTPWGGLTAETRSLLTSPLHLHLFMVTFDGKPAEPISKIPALFKQYAETSLKGRPGLQDAIDEVVSYLLQDVVRASADLSDDDCNRIRLKWTRAYSVAEARLNLSPVEALAHEGIIRKRVREEGGGYRFVFQTVAEYMVYRYLAQARARGEEELSYWVRRTSFSQVFAEYAGAFGFLLRDWEANGKLALASRLVEASPGWLRDVLTSFLVEQARVGYLPGRGSRAAEAAAKALVESGGAQTARVLLNAGYLLMATRFSPAARAYSQASRETYEALYGQNQENVEIAAGLGSALNNLGNLLSDAGRVGEAERAYGRSVEIYEALYGQNQENVGIGNGLGRALNSLGILLRAARRVGEAERAYGRSVEIYEALYAHNAEDVSIADGLAGTVNNLGLLLSAAGRVAEAERAYLRSAEIYEALHAKDPGNVEVKIGYAQSLCLIGRYTEAQGLVNEVLAVVRRTHTESTWPDTLRRN